MEEIKPKKERKFLKAIGEVALTLARELVLSIGKKLINKSNNKRQGLVLAFIILASTFAIAQYPTTGNKQRLGFQTTGDGLVFRGRASDTVAIKSSGLNNAYFILDTVNNILYNYIKTKGGWKFSNGDTIIIQGVTMPFDSITFKTAKDGLVGLGEVEYNDTQGSLIQGLKGGLVTNVIGQQLHQRVNNRTGVTLTKGTAVYLSGSQGNKITVAKALATSDPTSANTFGIVAEAILSNQSGFVITEGLLININTSSLVEDSAVYLSPTVAGGLTSTKPQAPLHSVYIGVCVKSNAGSGELFVKIRNGQELDELHDVRISSPVDRASLYYKSSEGLWRDTTAALLTSDTATMLTNYLKSNVNLASQVTGILPLSNGGTGATTNILARTNLGATVRGANVFTLADISALSFIRYNADNTVSQRAADGMRSDLGGTTIGQSMFTLTNPSAITYPRFNADNTVTALSDVNFRTAIGAGTSSTNGTVTNVTGTLPISVATNATTPAITIANAGVSTTGVVTASTQTFGGAKTFNGVLNAISDLNVTGIASLNGGVIIVPAASMTKIAGLNVSNAVGSITVGSGLSLASGTLSATATGTVTSVTGSGAIQSSGGTTPNITVLSANASTNGVVSTTTQVFGGNKTFQDIVGFNKAIQRPIATITGNTTIQTSNCWIIVNNTSGTTTLTLPDATIATGTELFIKTAQPQAVISASTNVVPITFLDTASVNILPATDGAWCTLVSNGTFWVIMAGSN